jgi:hypothetical protein
LIDTLLNSGMRKKKSLNDKIRGLHKQQISRTNRSFHPTIKDLMTMLPLHLIPQ